MKLWQLLAEEPVENGNASAEKGPSTDDIAPGDARTPEEMEELLRKEKIDRYYKKLKKKDLDEWVNMEPTADSPSTVANNVPPEQVKRTLIKKKVKKYYKKLDQPDLDETFLNYATTDLGFGPVAGSATPEKEKKAIVDKKVKKYYKKLHQKTLDEWAEDINQYGFKWVKKLLADDEVNSYYKKLNRGPQKGRKKKIREEHDPKVDRNDPHIINQMLMHLDRGVRETLGTLPEVEIDTRVGKDEFGDYSGGLIAMVSKRASKELTDSQRETYSTAASAAALLVASILQKQYSIPLEHTTFGYATPDRRYVVSFGAPPKLLLTVGIR